MAAPTIVGSPVTTKETSGGVATTDPFGITLPAGSPTNPELDLITVAVQFNVGSQRDYQVPSGWSLIGPTGKLFSNSEWETYLLVRVAGASPSLTFDKIRISTGLTSAAFGLAIAYRWAPAPGQTFSVSDAISVILGTFGTPNDPPSIALGSTTDAAIIAGAGAPASLTVTTYPTGYGVGQATISESGNDRRLSAAVKYVTGVSSEDPGAFTYSGTNSYGLLWTIAVRGTAPGVSGTAGGTTFNVTTSLIPGSASASSGATAAGVTFAITAALLAGGAFSGSGASAPGVTLTPVASIVAGLASGGGGGTLNFQAAGMEFIARTGLGLSTFARDVASAYRVEVFANGLTLGSPILTSGSLTTDSNGKLPNLTNPLLVAGTTYRVVPVRQSDGEAGYPRRMVAS